MKPSPVSFHFLHFPMLSPRSIAHIHRPDYATQRSSGTGRTLGHTWRGGAASFWASPICTTRDSSSGLQKDLSTDHTSPIRTVPQKDYSRPLNPPYLPKKEPCVDGLDAWKLRPQVGHVVILDSFGQFCGLNWPLQEFACFAGFVAGRGG